MTHIDRRRILTSLAAGAALTGIPTAKPKAAAFAAAEPESTALRERSERREGWVMAQQRCDSAEPANIDFWSMPWDGISYANYLPPQIRRGLVSYEAFPRRAESQNAMGAYKDDENRHGWFDLRKLARFIADPDGNHALAPMVAALLGAESAAGRTALMALASAPLGPVHDPWQQILPAFRRCYGATIGISHFVERGLCQQRAFYSRNFSKGYFDYDFLQPAALCDAVIVTSAGLIETDAGLCLRASTETLAGELARRLGYALLDPTIRDKIVGPRGPRLGTRFFALGSATLNGPAPLRRLQMILDHQSAFIAGSFAPMAVDDLPLFIATSRDDDAGLTAGTIDTIAWAASKEGYPAAPEMFATVQAPRYQADERYSPGALDLIALWPFKFDG